MTDNYNQRDINLVGGGDGNVQTAFVFQPGGTAERSVNGEELTALGDPSSQSDEQIISALI